MDTENLLKYAAQISRIVMSLCAEQVAKKTSKMATSNARKTALDGVERNTYTRINRIAEMLSSDYSRMAALYTRHTEAGFLASMHHVRNGIVVIGKATESQQVPKGGNLGELFSCIPNRGNVDGAKTEFKMAYSKARDAYPNENLQFEHRIKAFEIILFCQMMIFEHWEQLWEHEIEYFMKLQVVVHSTKKGQGIKYNAIVIFLHTLMVVLQETNSDLASTICQKYQTIEQLGYSVGAMQINSEVKQIHTAAIVGNVENLIELLQVHCDINLLDENGLSPLHYAVHHNHVECAQTLIVFGADIECPGENKQTPLHIAASSDNSIDCLNFLINHGANIQAIMDDGNTPLHVAAIEGAKTCLEALINAGASVNTRRHVDLVAPLHQAAIADNINCLMALIENGADMEIIDNESQTPLLAAAFNGSLACLKHLISSGADINARGHYGWSALHFAAYGGKQDCLIALLDAGMHVDVTEYQWLKTPLEYATATNSLDCLKTLILYGADVNAKSKCANFPLQTAVVTGSLDCLLELINHGAQLDEQDYDGDTALHDAATENHLECAKALIKAGANPNIRNNNDLFPHDRAKLINGPDSDCHEYLSKVAAAATKPLLDI